MIWTDWADQIIKELWLRFHGEDFPRQHGVVGDVVYRCARRRHYRDIDATVCIQSADEGCNRPSVVGQVGESPCLNALEPVYDSVTQHYGNAEIIGWYADFRCKRRGIDCEKELWLCVSWKRLGIHVVD